MTGEWIIYYGDGSTFCDQDGDPFAAPARDVQIIGMADPDTGQAFVRSNDYYWWNGEYWCGGDWFGLFDYLIEPGPKKVIFGRTIGRVEFQRVLQNALNNDYLPPKSAWHASERRAG